MKRRNTASKQEILNIFKSSNTALSHEMIQSEIIEKTDRATIYRIINRFLEDGLIHRIISDDGKQYFALCIDCEEKKHKHNHFHFRCTSCGTVECLDAKIKVSLPEGYTAAHFNGFISGECKRCV